PRFFPRANRSMTFSLDWRMAAAGSPATTFSGSLAYFFSPSVFLASFITVSSFFLDMSLSSIALFLFEFVFRRQQGVLLWAAGPLGRGPAYDLYVVRQGFVRRRERFRFLQQSRQVAHLLGGQRLLEQGGGRGPALPGGLKLLAIDLPQQGGAEVLRRQVPAPVRQAS